MIPKIIHQICLPTEKDIPPSFLPHLQQTKEYISSNLPNYILKRWSLDEIIEDSDLSKKLFDFWFHELGRVTTRNASFWSDIFRCYILYTYGGIYLDCDCTILKPFDDLLQYSFVANYPTHYYMVDIILSEPQHIVMHKLLDNYLYVCRDFYRRDPIYWLIIYNITFNTLKEHITSLRLSVSPKNLHEYPNCYVLHHFVNSWKEN